MVQRFDKGKPMADSTKERARLVTFGRGGDTVYCGRGAGEFESKCTIAGYGRPDRPHAADNLPAGVPALDLLPAIDTAEGWRYAITGPMVDVDLADDDVSECPQPSEIFAAAMLEDAGNQFGALLTLQAASRAAGKRPGPLDSVSVKAHIAAWMKLGARLGHTDGKGGIVWQ